MGTDKEENKIAEKMVEQKKSEDLGEKQGDKNGNPENEAPDEKQDAENGNPENEAPDENQNAGDEKPENEVPDENQDAEDANPENGAPDENQNAGDEKPENEVPDENQDAENENPENKELNENQDDEERAEEISTETQEPWAFPASENLPRMVGGAAVAALLIVVILFLLRQKRRRQEPDGTLKKAGQDGLAAGGGQSGGSLPVPVRVGQVQDIGARRDQQDSFWVSEWKDADLYREKGLMAVVADGMGGLSNGGMVSQMITSTCRNLFYQGSGSGAPDMRLLEMARSVNERVRQRLRGQQERSGSTLVEALIYQGKLYFLTVGDSRIYLLRGGKLICLNRPHVYSEELALDAVNGRRPLTQIYTDKQKDSLTSYIGAGKIDYLDRNVEGISLTDGDRILLASDGVFGTLSNEALERAVSHSPEEAADIIRRQIQAAARPSQDNYTAVIIEYREK